jgi:hypothetical protein
MMSATKKLSAGVYQVVGTDWAVKNDSHNGWWVARVVDGIDSLEPHDLMWINGTRSDAIWYAHDLQMRQA